MSNPTTHPPGTFCWIELATSDPLAAKTFYTQLFGWDVSETPISEDELYYIFKKNGADSAAMYKQREEERGAPPHWSSYVSVIDADAATEKAKSLGATVYAGPFDVMDHGRMSVIADPQGATFAVWQAKEHIGVGVRDEAGSLCWNELQARDVEVARTFYAALFGWKMKISPEYTELAAGDQPIGGIIASKSPPQVPSFWLPYFAVADCDASTAKAQSLGAAIYVPPTDIPNVGRFAVVADPQGAVFAFYQLT
jgi:predicted enzyme related to lactoylglutathione lyase